MREPPKHVRTAFGASGPGEPLTGGQGTTWRYGDLVLKPLDLSASALAWQAEHLPSIHATGVRLAPPVVAADGSLAVDGWTAWRNAAGGHLAGHWDEVIAAGNHLHEALRRLHKPGFVDERQDRWAVADRIAWGEQPAGPGIRTPLLQRLLAGDVPDDEPQLVHCDLTGNVSTDRLAGTPSPDADATYRRIADLALS